MSKIEPSGGDQSTAMDATPEISLRRYSNPKILCIVVSPELACSAAAKRLLHRTKLALKWRLYPLTSTGDR